LNHGSDSKSFCYAYENSVCCDGTIYLAIDQFYRVLLDILKIRPSSDGKITEEEIKAIIKEVRRQEVQEM
jgi:hypothetical protein